jgi:ribosome-binding protein aMBF1 (putative translation factor)
MVRILDPGRTLAINPGVRRDQDLVRQFGRNVRKAREERDLSQSQLGEAVWADRQRNLAD